MGSHLSDWEDSNPFGTFYDAWLAPYLRHGGQLPETQQKAAEADLFLRLEQHLSDLPAPDCPWGMKVPRTILMLEFWRRIFPGLKFIHVVRNGLDMAYSQNNYQLDRFGSLTLSREEQNLPRRFAAIAYYRTINLYAADYGETQLQSRYLRIRLEDLCTQPAHIIRRIFDFVEAPRSARLEPAVAEVGFPSTIGRWRAQPVDEVCEIMRIGQPALERFGYWNPSAWHEIENAARAPRWKRWLFERTAMKALPAW